MKIPKHTPVTEGGETMSLTREELRLLQKVLSLAPCRAVSGWRRDVALPLQDKLRSLELQAPMED